MARLDHDLCTARARGGRKATAVQVPLTQAVPDLVQPGLNNVASPIGVTRDNSQQEASAVSRDVLHDHLQSPAFNVHAKQQPAATRLQPRTHDHPLEWVTLPLSYSFMEPALGIEPRTC